MRGEHVSKKDIILKLLDLSGFAQQSKLVMDTQMEVLKDEGPEVYQLIEEYGLIDKIVNEDMKQLVIELYDKYFNERQLKKLLEVYEDPDMRKLLEDAPKIFLEVSQRLDEMIEKRLDALPLDDI